MSVRGRSLLPKRWRDAIRPDDDLAAAEGLAAGTGLLTGEVARTSTRPAAASSCPSCARPGDVVVVDLVLESTTMRCTSCGRRWTVSGDGEVLGG
jgi:hypothetical protein